MENHEIWGVDCLESLQGRFGDVRSTRQSHYREDSVTSGAPDKVTTGKIRWHQEHQTKSLQGRFSDIRSTRKSLQGRFGDIRSTRQSHYREDSVTSGAPDSHYREDSVTSGAPDKVTTGMIRWHQEHQTKSLQGWFGDIRSTRQSHYREDLVTSGAPDKVTTGKIH